MWPITKIWTPYFCSPQSKYIEIFGPLEQICLKYMDSLWNILSPYKTISNFICTHLYRGPDISAEIINPPLFLCMSYPCPCVFCIQLSTCTMDSLYIILWKDGNWPLTSSQKQFMTNSILIKITISDNFNIKDHITFATRSGMHI